MKQKILIASLLMFSTPIFAMGDGVADFMSWVVLIVLPVVGVYLFWKAHIYPEEVAKKNNHPQFEAIKTMCLLSLLFGGLLWPVALIWANYNYGDKNKNTKNKEDNHLTSTENTQEVPVKSASVS